MRELETELGALTGDGFVLVLSSVLEVGKETTIPPRIIVVRAIDDIADVNDEAPRRGPLTHSELGGEIGRWLAELFEKYDKVEIELPQQSGTSISVTRDAWRDSLA